MIFYIDSEVQKAKYPLVCLSATRWHAVTLAAAGLRAVPARWTPAPCSSRYSVGDRVLYTSLHYGAAAGQRTVPARWTPVPCSSRHSVARRIRLFRCFTHSKPVPYNDLFCSRSSIFFQLSIRFCYVGCSTSKKCRVSHGSITIELITKKKKNMQLL